MNVATDLWTGLKPWKVMRFNTLAEKWECIGAHTHRGEAETIANKMNRACQIQYRFKIFKVVFDSSNQENLTNGMAAGSY